MSYRYQALSARREQAAVEQEQQPVLRRIDDPRRRPATLALLHGLQLLRRRGTVEHPQVLSLSKSLLSVRALEERHPVAARGAAAKTGGRPEEDQVDHETREQGDDQAGRPIDRQTYAFLARRTVRLCPHTDPVIRQPYRYIWEHIEDLIERCNKLHFEKKKKKRNYMYYRIAFYTFQDLW